MSRIRNICAGMRQGGLLSRELDMQLFQDTERVMRYMAQIVLALGEFEIVDPVDKGLEAPIKLAAGERRAEAMMDARAEAEMRTSIFTVEIYFVRAVELARVAVGRRVAYVDDRALGNFNPVHLDIRHGGSN